MADWVRILKGECRHPRAAESVRILKKGMQGSTDGRIGPNYERGIAGIHGPPIWSEFFKENAGIHGRPDRSEF